MAKQGRPPLAVNKDRIFQNIKVDNDTGCWIWTGAINSRGYGCLSVMGKYSRAHRVSYSLFVEPIPNGLCVLHKCDTPSCVCPWHLFTGTHKDNSDDKIRKGRAVSVCGESHAQSKLKEKDVIEIINILNKGGVPQHVIAKRFGVTQTAISAIKRGNSWAHLTNGSTCGRPSFLTEYEVVAIIDLLDSGNITQENLAKDFGVCTSTIGAINTGASWSKLTKRSRTCP